MASTLKLCLAGVGLGFSLGLSGALVVACSSSSSPQPVINTYDASGAGVADSGSSPLPDSGTTADAGADVAQSAQDAQSDVANDAASEAAGPSCAAQLTDAGCWTCPARTDASLEYLNQCSGTGVRCVPFSNAVLPGYDAGGLPPLN